MEENGGEAAELPADPSSVSVEANDAKTGVHCPQLRARKERMREKERSSGKESSREKQRVFLCFIAVELTHTNLRHHVLPRKERGQRCEGSAVNLIFKCKQIYIVAKAPPTDVILLSTAVAEVEEG